MRTKCARDIRACHRNVRAGQHGTKRGWLGKDSSSTYLHEVAQSGDGEGVEEEKVDVVAAPGVERGALRDGETVARHQPFGPVPLGGRAARIVVGLAREEDRTGGDLFERGAQVCWRVCGGEAW